VIISGPAAPYQGALKTDPGFGEAHSNLAVVHLQTNRFELAAQELTLAERPVSG
jgi:hypothetical protein